MNLEDVIDSKYGLQQDEWSLSKPRFGNEGQLEVIGIGARLNYHKIYILKCSICTKDSELFGQGYFTSLKGCLMRGKIPCGCSTSPKWSKEQYAVLCYRKAQELGYKFLGFEGNWKGNKTKLKMFCQKHGEWGTGIISNLLCSGFGCPKCRTDSTIISNRKPDGVMITSFFASGAFHPDTKFWRSERLNHRNTRSYWFMSCPECGETGETESHNLQKGKRSCGCNMHRQKECYINLLLEDEQIVAIKFGIARDSKQRIKSQERLSKYSLSQHSVYTFSDVDSCKKAERDCLQELECGVVPKYAMEDGYTETTWYYNLEKVIYIYESNGGVRIE